MQGAKRGKKASLLPPWLPKCYHMVHSPSLSHGFSVFLLLPLSLMALHWACLWLQPRQARALWFKPRACCTKPWTHFEAKLRSLPSSPPIPLQPPTPHPTPLQLQGKAVFWQEMNSSQMSAGTWEVVRKRRTPLRRPGLLPATGGMWESASLTHASTALPSTTPPDWLTASVLGPEPGNRLIDRATATKPGNTAHQPASRAAR